MSVSFREEDVDLSRLPEDSRDIESQAFVESGVRPVSGAV